MTPYFALIAVGLDAAATRFLSKIEKTAAAVVAAVVGVVLLVGSTTGVQAACDPPVFNVCFHKYDEDWSTAGTAAMIVEFNGLPGKTYRYQFSGLMYHFDYTTGDSWVDRGWERGRFSGEKSLSCHRYWWDPDRGGTGGYLRIYEEGTSNSWLRGGPKVLGKWIASVDFYPYQRAALVYLNNSALPFGHEQYYCTIDWETPIQLRHGYSEGYWVYAPWQWNPKYPHHRPWFYMGDPGSPRQPYRRRCLVTVNPPPRTSGNTRSW